MSQKGKFNGKKSQASVERSQKYKFRSQNDTTPHSVKKTQKCKFK